MNFEVFPKPFPSFAMKRKISQSIKVVSPNKKQTSKNKHKTEGQNKKKNNHKKSAQKKKKGKRERERL